MGEWKASWSREQHETATGESINDGQWTRLVEALDEAVMYTLEDWGA